MRSHGLDVQPVRFGLRCRFGLCGLVDVFLHRGQLGLDAGEVFLGIGEGLGVAERLADALLGFGALVLGAGEVGAGLLQK